MSSEPNGKAATTLYAVPKKAAEIQNLDFCRSATRFVSILCVFYQFVKPFPSKNVPKLRIAKQPPMCYNRIYRAVPPTPEGMISMSVNTGTILVFCPDRPVWLTKLRGALIPLGVRVRFVAQEELSQSVGALAGLPGPDPINSPPPASVEEPVLVLCHFSGAALNRVLDCLRKAGVPRTVLKAVLTETNASWSLSALYEELCEERRALSGDPDANPRR